MCPNPCHNRNTYMSPARTLLSSPSVPLDAAVDAIFQNKPGRCSWHKVRPHRWRLLTAYLEPRQVFLVVPPRLFLQLPGGQVLLVASLLLVEYEKKCVCKAACISLKLQSAKVLNSDYQSRVFFQQTQHPFAKLAAAENSLVFELGYAG